MRTLATLSFSFGAGVLVCMLLPLSGWQVYGAAIMAALGVAAIFLRKKHRYGRHAVVIAFAVAASLLYCVGYDALVAAPVREKCGAEGAFSGTVCDYPVATTYGAKVTVHLDGSLAKAVYYGEEALLSTEPGDRISGNARWQDAANIHDNDVTTFTSRGVYVLLYSKGAATITPGQGSGVRYAPVRMCRAFQEKVAAIWGEGDIGGMVSGILTGDLSSLSDDAYTKMKEVGLAHLFAVSGMNCAFLVSLLWLLLSKRHLRAGTAVIIAVLLFYMCMVGLTPSVVRATIMQIFLLLGPLFQRDSDPPTALGTALLIILLCNPNAIMSVGLQLSFAATLGLITVAPKVYRAIMDVVERWTEKKKGRYVLAIIAANLSATAGAMLFTVPLMAYYFNSLALISPLSNLLVVAVVGWGFMAAFLTTVMGFIWLPLAQILGYATTGLMTYALWAVDLLVRIPYHAVYFTGRYLRVWLVFVYAAIVVCCVTKDRARKYLFAGVLSVLMLVLCLGLERRTYDYGDMTATVWDVGQGLSVAVHGTQTALIDCGSANSYIRAGTVVADGLASVGVKELEAVVVTHYHADHTNGLMTLFSRVPVRTLYLPDIADEFGVREKLLTAAKERGTNVVFVHDVTEVDLGTAAIMLYPPIGEGDLNEQGLAAIAAAGDFQVAVTGDMSSATERALAERYDLPDCEVLVVGHHGSSGSTAEEFLEEIRPETAIISVGDNSYGHPTEETLLRLAVADCQVYRTDNAGHIQVKVGE